MWPLNCDHLEITFGHSFVNIRLPLQITSSGILVTVITLLVHSDGSWRRRTLLVQMLLLLLRLLDDCRGLRVDEPRRPAVHVLGPDERQLLLPLQLVDPLLVSPEQHSVKGEGVMRFLRCQ